MVSCQAMRYTRPGMSTQGTFERARRPAQKQERRASVLAAAARLFDDRGMDGTTLSAVAREVGLAKSNLYRYFESREAILLQLYLGELESWSIAVGEAMRPLHGSDDIDAVANALVTSMVDRRRLLELSTAVPAVLEHNVSEGTVIEKKRGTQRELTSIVDSLSKALPTLGPELSGCFFQHFCMHAVGAWPTAHPSEVVKRVQQRPEFALTCVDYEGILRDHARIVLRGLAAGSKLP